MSIPVTDPYYRVEVDAGSHSWVSVKGDAAGYGLADPLRVAWSLPASNPLFHAQPDPMNAAFSVVVAAAVDVADLGRGAEVLIKVYGWPPGTDNPHAEADDLDPVDYPPIVIFRGRVADVSGAPHKLGMVYTYSCVDYTVDLAEETIGAIAWPEEDNSVRLGRMFDEAGVLRPADIGVPGVYFWDAFNVITRAASPADARTLIWQLVDQVTDGPDGAFGRYQYMATSYAAGYLAGDVPDPLEPYAVPAIWARLYTGDGVGAAPFDRPLLEAPRLPAVLAITTPGKYGVDIVEHADRRAAIIDADHVDFNAAWSQSKRTDPDKITITGQFLDPLTGLTSGAITVQNPDSIPIGATLPCDIKAASAARAFAQANLVSSDSDQWVANTFTWYADQDPWPMIADGLWFIEGMHVIASRSPVVINGIDPDKNPTGLDWYAGRLRSAVFTLARGRYSVTFQLLRQLLRPQVFDASLPGEGVGTLAWDDLDAAPFTAVKWTQLDAAYSWFDARLLRSP